LQENLSDDSGSPQLYDLEANFWITGEGISVQPSNIATRVRLTGHVTWTLRTRDAARTQLTGGASHLVDGVNLLDQQYFAFDLENEVVQKRLANALAEQVASQLAIFFRHRAEKSPNAS
jgi:LPS-assembly lipoprotein